MDDISGKYIKVYKHKKHLVFRLGCSLCWRNFPTTVRVLHLDTYRHPSARYPIPAVKKMKSDISSHGKHHNKKQRWEDSWHVNCISKFKMLKYPCTIFFLYMVPLMTNFQTLSSNWHWFVESHARLHQVWRRDKETLQRNKSNKSLSPAFQLFQSLPDIWCNCFALPFRHRLWKRRTPQEWHKSSERHRTSHVHQLFGYCSLHLSNFLYFCDSAFNVPMSWLSETGTLEISRQCFQCFIHLSYIFLCLPPLANIHCMSGRNHHTLKSSASCV